jgi:hypothetical protein
MKTFNQVTKRIFLLIFAILLSTNVHYVAAQPTPIRYKNYLPVIEKNVYHGYVIDQKFIGIYMQYYWTDANVSTYMPIADNLAGKKHSVSGWFINFQNIAFTSRQNDNKTNNFYRQLEALWKNGYIPFVNIGSASVTAPWDVTDNCPIPFNSYQIASGACDGAIQKMADLYHQWISLGNGRKAFLAPLPEMNGVRADGSLWTSYGGDPANFKLAYQRIQNIFAQKGVTLDQVWWVFAPNGWSKAGNEFENYYPGDNVTDVVAFSMYNYGWCWVALAFAKWENYTTLYEPYISRMALMAPMKPIIIAQTGTTAQYGSVNSFNVSMKNAWLQENYGWLADQPQVLGIMYYDYDLSPDECNWTITNGNTFQPGYHAGAAYPAFQYLNWQDLQSIIP